MENQNDILKITHINNEILHLTLNRPSALNALSAEVLEKLHQALISAKDDSKIKSILISGEGKAFCAGADIKQLAALDGQTGMEFAHRGQLIFRTLEQIGKPSLAAINGLALGGGCELAMSATMRIATETASFGQPEVKLGVIPGFGGTQRLARLVGKGRALDLCLSGRLIKAETALAWGLVNEIVPADNLITRATEILNSLNKLAPIALKSVMSVIDEGYDLPLDQAMQVEAKAFALCCGTADKKEGVSAFIEKRVAEFTGA